MELVLGRTYYHRATNEELMFVGHPQINFKCYLFRRTVGTYHAIGERENLDGFLLETKQNMVMDLIRELNVGV